MTRNGKIARLPQAVREQLNELLAEGEPGNQLVRWLNSLPEVKEVLAKEFAGNQISESNLTGWKQGGYLDWILQQETLEVARTLMEEAGELGADSPHPVSDRVGAWLAARCAVTGRQLVRDGDQLDWSRFRALCHDVVALRRSDLGAQRLKLGEARVELARQKVEQQKRRIYDQWLDDPDVREELVAEEQRRRRAEANELVERRNAARETGPTAAPGSEFPQTDENSPV